MPQRPLPVTIISWLFMATGVVGLAYHATELDLEHPFEDDAIWVCLLRLLAIVGGAFMLRGHNTVRWLLVAWMAYHIVLSAMHSMTDMVVHAVLFGTIAWFLFRPPASAFFQGRN